MIFKKNFKRSDQDQIIKKIMILDQDQGGKMTKMTTFKTS
jgi:hypothetical protein